MSINDYDYVANKKQVIQKNWWAKLVHVFWDPKSFFQNLHPLLPHRFASKGCDSQHAGPSPWVNRPYGKRSVFIKMTSHPLFPRFHWLMKMSAFHRTNKHNLTDWCDAYHTTPCNLLHWSWLCTLPCTSCRCLQGINAQV